MDQSEHLLDGHHLRRGEARRLPRARHRRLAQNGRRTSIPPRCGAVLVALGRHPVERIEVSHLCLLLAIHNGLQSLSMGETIRLRMNLAGQRETRVASGVSLDLDVRSHAPITMIRVFRHASVATSYRRSRCSATCVALLWQVRLHLLPPLLGVWRTNAWRHSRWMSCWIRRSRHHSRAPGAARVESHLEKANRDTLQGASPRERSRRAMLQRAIVMQFRAAASVSSPRLWVAVKAKFQLRLGPLVHLPKVVPSGRQPGTGPRHATQRSGRASWWKVQQCWERRFRRCSVGTRLNLPLRRLENQGNLGGHQSFPLQPCCSRLQQPTPLHVLRSVALAPVHVAGEVCLLPSARWRPSWVQEGGQASPAQPVQPTKVRLPARHQVQRLPQMPILRRGHQEALGKAGIVHHLQHTRRIRLRHLRMLHPSGACAARIGRGYPLLGRSTTRLFSMRVTRIQFRLWMPQLPRRSGICGAQTVSCVIPRMQAPRQGRPEVELLAIRHLCAHQCERQMLRQVMQRWTISTAMSQCLRNHRGLQRAPRDQMCLGPLPQLPWQPWQPPVLHHAASRRCLRGTSQNNLLIARGPHLPGSTRRRPGQMTSKVLFIVPSADIRQPSRQSTASPLRGLSSATSLHRDPISEARLHKDPIRAIHLVKLIGKSRPRRMVAVLMNPLPISWCGIVLQKLVGGHRQLGGL